MTLLNRLITAEQSPILWLFIFILSSASMGFALYYQYALDWDPCVLCIHIRIIMFGLILLSLMMIYLCRFRALRLIGFLGQTALATLLYQRANELYRVEIGLEDAGCLFSAGLPSWFDLEAWLPSLFEVRSACGVSPNVLLNITMAESLYLTSAFALVVASILSLLSIGLFIRDKTKS